MSTTILPKHRVRPVTTISHAGNTNVCLRFLFCDKQMIKRNLGRKGIISSYTSSLTLCHSGKSKQEWKVRSQRKELKQKPWRTVAFWLIFHGLLNLLFYDIQDYLPRGGITHSDMGFSTLTSNQEKSPTDLSMDQFNKLKFLQDISILYHVNKKQTTTATRIYNNLLHQKQNRNRNQILAQPGALCKLQQ